MGTCRVVLWRSVLGDGTSAGERWLSAAEQARADEYVQPADRERFVLGAALLRAVVARHTGGHPARVRIERRCPDCDRPHGRPTAPGSGLALSIAHSGELVVVAAAVGSAGIGVDVEQIPASLDQGVLDFALAPNERAWVTGPGADADPDVDPAVETGHRAARFTQVWTVKEAVCKATGDGLRVPLAGIQVTPAKPTPRSTNPSSPETEASDLVSPQHYWRLLAYPGADSPPRMAIAQLPPGELASGMRGAVAALGVRALVITWADGAAEFAGR